VAALTGFDQPAVFAPLIGIGCGYGVKVAGEDRPGVFFSIAAATLTLVGAVIGKVAAVLVAHHDFGFSAASATLAAVGTAAGVFIAWKVGGGDF